MQSDENRVGRENVFYKVTHRPSWLLILIKFTCIGVGSFYYTMESGLEDKNSIKNL